MNVRKFIANSAREALLRIKEALGPDAIILSNRNVPGGVEIMAVAASDMAMIVPSSESREGGGRASPPPPPKAAPSSPQMPMDEEDDDYTVALSSRAQVPAPPRPVTRSALATGRPPVSESSPGVPGPSAYAAPPPRFDVADSFAPSTSQVVPESVYPGMAPGDPGAARHSPPAPERYPGGRLEPSFGTVPPPAAPYAPPPIAPGVSSSPWQEGPKGGASIVPPSRSAVSGGTMPATPSTVTQIREVVPAAVMDEIRSLRKVVEQHMAGLVWGETMRNAPVKTDVLSIMLDAGFSPQLLRDFVSELPPELDLKEALVWVRGVIDRSMLAIGSDNDLIERGGVFALVGPTGVGKTTTTAKLAARCVLRHGPGKVALVTTDGYRIGAHEQLRIYGRILGVTVHLVKDEQDLRQTLGDLVHKHMVLIDTMGMSQKDKHVTDLIGMLSGCNVRRLLLLSATSRGDTLDDVVQSYKGDGLEGCILTKVDEAASLGASLDVVIRNNLCVHYVSNGQRVPEDLHLPNRAYLIHRAFREIPESSPHRLKGNEPALTMANAGVLSFGAARG